MNTPKANALKNKDERSLLAQLLDESRLYK
jgi:hypothetical protein